VQPSMLILLCLALVGCLRAERVQLDGTNVSVAVPSGFVRQEGLETDRPYVEFNLPPDRDGTQTLFPALSLGDLAGRLAPARSVEAYLAGVRARVGDNWIVEPRAIEIARIPAMELSFREPSIAHLSSGGVLERTVTTHLIILSLGQRHYRCGLTSEPADYSRLVPRLYQFCRSVRVSDEIA
jgi:hypothetical protein